jgi:hypothetical protein
MTDERPFVDDPDEPGNEPIVGPGSGGSPTAPGVPDADERLEARADPDVRAVLEALEDDETAAPADFDEAAEQAGTGTDR